MAHSGLACAFPFGPRLGKAQASASLGSFNPLGLAPSLDLGHGSPHLLAAPEERSPRSFSSPCFISRLRQAPSEGSVTPNGCATACKWVLPPPLELATLKVRSLCLRSPREGSPLLLLLSGVRGLRGKGVLALVYWSRRLERRK